MGERAIQLVEFLYRDVQTVRAKPSSVRLQVIAEHSGLLCLRRGEAVLYQGREAAVAAEQLAGHTCYHLADKSEGGLLMHAAAVAWQGQGILLPGASGAGKSTLTAWLLNQSFTYLTDELVFLPEQSAVVQALTRPLHLKRPSRTVLQSCLDFARHTGQIVSAPHIDLVPPELLNPEAPLSSAPLQYILFPRYRPQSRGEWHRLSSAQAGLALMGCLINARNLSNHGFNQVSALTRRAPAYRLEYGHFSQLQEPLKRIVFSGADAA